MTHDLMAAALRGFGIEVKRVIISSLVETTFGATIVLERSPVVEGEGEGMRETVMLDARASDSIVLALKFGVQLEVSRQVIEEAMDIQEQLAPSVPEDILDQIKGLIEEEEEESEEDEPGWMPPSEGYDPEKE
jgi:bifunctional DNase/RNase